MSNFIYNSYCVEHPGVVQFGQAAHAEISAPVRKSVRVARSNANGSLVLGLVAVVAALMLVASHAEAHMQAAWMALIIVAGLALALFTVPVRRALKVLRSGYRAWVEARHQAAADEQIWNAALQDARLMADLARAMDSQRRF